MIVLSPIGDCDVAIAVGSATANYLVKRQEC
jgi:hypothetical protein